MNKIKIIFISLIFCLTFLPSNSYAILDLFEDENIYYVKNGAFYFDQSITVGQAFEGNQYLTNPNWRSFNDSQGRKYVEFTADVKLDMLYAYAKKNFSFEISFHNVSEFNMPLEIIVQFVINLDDTFEFKDLMFRSPIKEFTYSESLFDFEIPIMAIYENELPNFFMRDYIKSSKNGLINAIKAKNSELVKEILKFNVNLNYKDKNYGSPLIEAVIGGNLKIVELLISNGADINFFHGEFSPPFFIAIRKDDLKMVKLLIEHGADIDYFYYNLYTALFIAVDQNNFEMVKLLIDNGADINKKNSHNQTALDIALHKKQMKIVNLLIDRGADTSIKNQLNQTTLEVAIQKNDLETAKLLIDNGADVKSLSPILFVNAMKNDNLESIQFLIDHGADINYFHNDFYPPLYIAMAKNNLEMVKLLINNGADINKADKGSYPPIFIAVQKNNLELTKLLIDNGVEIKSFLPELFASAVLNNNLEITKLLIDKGVDVNYANEYLYPPIFIAIAEKDLEMVKLLINKGADINNFYNDYTPLLLATEICHIKIVKLLLSSGVDIYKTNKNGKSALDIAKEKNCYPIIIDLDLVNLKNKKKPNIMEKPLQNSLNSHQPIDEAEKMKNTQDVMRILQDTENSKNLNDQANKNTQESKHDKEEDIQKFTQGLVAPESKKAGTALIMPYDKDNMSLTSFTSDHINDSLIRVLIRNQSPLIAVRVENMKGKIGSWKTKDVETSAMGILKIENKGAVINHNNISFKLNISNPLELDLIMQDNGAITDPNTDLRVVFFFEDGNRAYSLVKR